MPTVANRMQPVYVPGLAPMAAYSRAVSLNMEVSEAGGLAYAYSQTLGTRFWLLGIQAWVSSKVPNNNRSTWLSFRIGSGVPTDATQMALWDELVSLAAQPAPKAYWDFYDGDTEKSWGLSKRFEGESRRFGIIGGRTGAAVDIVQVSFIISEG